MRDPARARRGALRKRATPVLALAGLVAVTRLCMALERSESIARRPPLALLLDLLPIALALGVGAFIARWAGRLRREVEEQRRRAETALLEARLASLERAAEEQTVQAMRREAEERAAMERRLRESEARFRRIAESAHDAIFRFHLQPQRGFDFVNPALRTLTGYGQEDLAGDDDPWARLVHPADRAALADLAAIEGKPLELRWVRRDGTYAWIEQVIALERRESGQLVAFEAIARDISERRHLEMRLQLADRLAAVGTLAAGLVHEINNPLCCVTSSMSFVKEQLELPQGTAAPGSLDELRHAVGEAVLGAERMKEIVQRLHRFSHMGAGTRGPADVRGEIEVALALAREQVARRAQLVVEVGELPPVQAGQHDIGQVVLNLLLNAAQAIPEGQADRNQVRVGARTDARGRVVIEVRDTGCGIPRENLRRIFDPFFTTRPPGQGTGLGLSISMGIVSCAGGTIEVESEPGKGSLFRVVLPSTAEVAPEPEPSPTPPPRRQGRVLVVDDEPLVGRAVARLLRTEHAVEALTSPLEALRRATAGDRWDVVLCDMMMPEMDGPTLAARLAEVAPELAERVVFMTGGAFTETARAFLSAEARLSVEKPIESAALRAVVARRMAALDRPAPPG